MPVLIKDWYIVRRSGSSHVIRKPEDSGTMQLEGIVYGHPHIKEGNRSVTSRVLGRHENYIVTESRLYVLGSSSVGFEDFCPNAADRLFAALPEIPLNELPEQPVNAPVPAHLLPSEP